MISAAKLFIWEIHHKKYMFSHQYYKYDDLIIFVYCQIVDDDLRSGEGITRWEIDWSETSDELTGVRLVMIGHDATVVNDCLLTDILIYNNI